MQNSMAELSKKSQECIAKSRPALERAAGVGASLNLSGSEKELRTIATNLERDHFTVILFGRFRCGKSTLLNALLGKSEIELSDACKNSGPMPVDINPTTARPTRIYYAPKPEVFAIRRTGDTQEKDPWTFENYITQAKQKPSKEATEAFFAGIEGFEVGFPTAFCKGGVQLLDTPGTDDNAAMDLVTFTAAKDADAAVLTLSHPGTMGMQEKQYMEDLMASGLRSFLTVVNARDPDPPTIVAMPPSEETNAVTWNRIVVPLRKRQLYSGKALESEDVFFLNAFQAFKGRMSGDAKAVEKSGIQVFENRLAEYLEAEPRFVHLQRFLGAAEPVLDAIEQAIAKQSAALSTDQQIGEEQLAEVQQKLEQIPKRAARIPGIIKRYCSQAQLAVQQSLEDLYAGIATSLPEYMKHKQIPSLHQESFLKNIREIVKSRINQAKLTGEATEIAVTYVRSRVQEWQSAGEHETGATQALRPHFDNMIQELKEEATAIEQQYNEAQIQLTGWTPPSVSNRPQGVSLANRVSAAAFGVLTGNFDYAITGGMGGWNSVFRDLLGRIAIAAPLVFLFHLSLPVALPIAMVGGILWGVFGGAEKLETELKNNAVQTLLNGYPADPSKSVLEFGGLANEPRRLRTTIAATVAEKFDQIETAVMKVVNGQIQIEEETLRNQKEDQLRSATERAQKLQQLNQYQADIQLSRAELKQAWTSAAQQKSLTYWAAQGKTA